MDENYLPAPLQVFSRIAEKVSRTSYYCGMACLFLMMFPICFDVVARLVFHSSVPGALELTEMLMLLMVTLCGAAPQLNNSHMCVELVYEHCSKRLQQVLMLFHMTAGTVYVLIMTSFMYDMTIEKLHHQEYTPDLHLPVGIFIAVACVGISILLLSVFRSFLLIFFEMLHERRFISIILTLTAVAIFCSLPWLLKGTAVAKSMPLAGGLAMCTMLLLLLLRMPIGYAMGIMGLIGMMLIYPKTMSGLNMTGISVIHTASSYTYSVIPMFILMGEIALFAGISKSIFRSASICLGRVPGGLAVASVAGCAGFAAICGDSLATGMTMGSVALPEMKRYKYNMGLSTAALAAGGTLGILIPPSVGFIFYSLVTEESLGRLFIAGVIPGLLLATIFCLAIVLMVKRDPSLAPMAEKTTFSEKIRSLSGLIPMIALIILVLGGILSGIFSPTEGGAVGAFGTLVYAIVSRTLTWSGFKESLHSTCHTTTRLMFILIGVNILGYFLAATRLPFLLSDWLVTLEISRYAILAVIIAVYIIMGCLMNVVPMILLTLPSIFPSVVALGFDPIWFGVITVIMMEMGQITPPVGIVVFALAGMPDAPPMATIFKYILPFVMCMILCVLLLTIFPSIALFLPRLLF